MTYRFHGSDGSDGSNRSAVWSRRRNAANRVMRASDNLSLRPGADTIVGAQELIDALDAYWQVRFGGRWLVVVTFPSGRQIEAEVTPDNRKQARLVARYFLEKRGAADAWVVKAHEWRAAT